MDLDEWINVLMDGWINMNGQMDVNGWMYGGWMDGLMYVCMDGWMDEYIGGLYVQYFQTYWSVFTNQVFSLIRLSANQI